MKREQRWPVGERPNHANVIRLHAVSLVLGVLGGVVALVTTRDAKTFPLVVLGVGFSIVTWITAAAARSDVTTVAFVELVAACGLGLIDNVSHAPLLVLAVFVGVAGCEAGAFARQLDSVVAMPAEAVVARGRQIIEAIAAGGVLGAVILIAYTVGLPRSAAIATIAAGAAVAVVAIIAFAASAARHERP